MITRAWRVYGAEGHRQKVSFLESARYDFSKPGAARGIEMRNADLTGTHDFTEVRITRETAEECYRELLGQVSDGIFENSRTGAIVEIATA